MAQDWSLHEFDVGFARYAREAGWIVDRGVHLLEEFSDWSRWDGMAIWLYGHRASLLRRLQRVSAPVVNLRAHPTAGPWAHVRCDHHAIGIRAADYFLERGFERFMYLSSHEEGGYGERGRAFRERVRARGGHLVAARYRQDPRLSQSEGMIEFVKQTVTDQSFPLAIFSPADMFAALAVDACLLMGIDVPTQVAVVGCDNDGLFNELARIPLSSMDTDISHYGWVAAETLDRMMRGKTVPKTVLIPPRGVITRRSSDILAVEDDALRKAVSFMSSHYADPIHVGDITHACGMSRRLLQTRFRALLHRTVQEDLTRMRVEYAAHLLRTTSHKTDFIGAASGLSNGERLARVFKRAVGQSPREYRQYYRHANLPGSNAPVDPLPDRAASQDARRGGQDARAPAERLAGRLRGAQRSGIP